MSKVGECERWLRNHMQRVGTAPSSEVKAEAAKFGFSEGTVFEARQYIGEIEITTGGFPRRSTWTWTGAQPRVPPIKPEPPKPKEQRLQPLMFTVEQFTSEAHRQARQRQQNYRPRDTWPL